jgi:hypothetical protein
MEPSDIFRRFVETAECLGVPYFVTGEDVIVRLECFGEGGSDKHIRDVVCVMKTQGTRLDRAYVADRAARLGLTDLRAECLQRAPLETA